MSDVRKYTNALIEAVENGEIDALEALLGAVKYMSEDEVKDMVQCNDFLPWLEDDSEYEDDGQPSWEQEWEDFGESGYDVEHI